MERFSERIGAVKSETTLQVDSISNALRNSLWNLFLKLYERQRNHSYWYPVASYIARYFRKIPADELPAHDDQLREWVKKYFFSLPWYAAYDLTEFLVHTHYEMTTISYGDGSHQKFIHPTNPERFMNAINNILERELSGFRFIQGSLVPITNAAEIEEIDLAVVAAGKFGFAGAQTHVRTALGLLGKKPMPDYRNAIKEAISAVETVVKKIVGAESATLDAALKELGKKTDIHGALSSGFSKLYGYTSDEGGIRHAILDEPNVGFAEAKYMIVSCSAFVNFLIQKADAAGLAKAR